MAKVAVQDQRTKETRGLTLAHVTDLGRDDQPAFAHAVLLAQRSASTLVTIHANYGGAKAASLPRAADLLLRWGKLPASGSEGEEQWLGMRHEQLVDSASDDVVDTLLEAIQRTQPQLLIATTRKRSTLDRLVLGSVASALALQIDIPTLILPLGARPFVQADTGELQLERILVAAGDEPAARAGAAHAAWVAEIAGASKVEIELLEVTSSNKPLDTTFAVPARMQVRVNRISGSFEEQFLARAESWPADLMVIATRGHDSPRDVLLGSHAEHVLHGARCPVLWVPLQ